MLPLLLVRHGRTACNAERRFAGTIDVDLDEVGRAQARALRVRLHPLRIAAVYASPLQRAVRTVAELTQPILVPALAELDHGVLEGQPQHVLAREHPALLRAWLQDPSQVRIPGGESLAQCQARVMAALEPLARRHVQDREPVLLVSHQLTMACLLCGLLGRPLSRFRSLTTRNTGINVLGWDARSWTLLAQDDTRHLSPPSQG